jgi:ABC-type multidrug transport system fused ATPase/permease subunit
MSTIKKYLELLTHSEQKRAYLLLGMILIMALLDVIGVASIMPFMAVLANPHLLETSSALSMAQKLFGFVTHQDFLFALGVLVFSLLVLSLAFKALTTYAQTWFALMREYTIGKRLVEGYLHQPYSWFLNRHSADLGKTVLSEVASVVHGGMLPLLNLIAQAAVATAILILLIIVDPILALSVGFVLGFAYLIVFRLMNGRLKHLGEERIIANQQRYTAVVEAFGAAKEVKVGGLENSYTQRFAFPAQIYARSQTTAQVISQLPRFVLEAVAFGGMLIVILYLMTKSGSFATALPVIALYAFAGYRLMPALQQIYGSLTQLRFVNPALNALHQDLKSLEQYKVQASPIPVFQLAESICLEDVFYRYPLARQSALKGITLTVAAKTTVGLVGSTGSGKTTTVDLILGLLEAQSGSLLVDGKIISREDQRSWQKAIGYVPQQIYLSDDTISANIAFGVEGTNIDKEAVERAAKIANLHDFVVNELPMGYQTSVGERGVRLSGGQRQRIGIARALYHQPQVLILDEATSALDNLTEQAVMEAVYTLGHEITIILIAHRLSTVRDCDTIFLLENGTIKAQGTFDELIELDDRFRSMAATL